MTYAKSRQQRKYPYEYELEQQKYQQQAAAAAAAHQQQQQQNYEYENEPVMSSFDKINQITTLDHHGNKKMEHIRKQAQRAALQQQKNNRIVAPSTSSDFPLPPPNAASNQNQTRKNIPNGKLKKLKETTKKEPIATAPTVISLDTDDELGEMKLISDQESTRDSDKDLSFTLPKPMNLKKV